MKLILYVLCFSFFAIEAEGQYTKYIVRLNNKAGNAYSLDNPSQFLSSRAIQRRTKYNISYDSTDLPVTAKYIDSIRSAVNVTILSVSKWLNEVLIQTSDLSAITKIQSFPFVAGSGAVAPRLASPGAIRFKEVVTLSNLQQRTAGTLSNDLDYGNSFNQVHIHEGEYLHNKGFHGENVQVTMLDAGFYQYKTNTAFDSIRMNGQVLGERDFADFDNSVDEDDTHGMYCLSTMAANWPGKMVGTAPKANYWLVRTERASSEYPVEEHNWVVGAEFADSTGTDLITSSLGYNTFDDPFFNHTYGQFYKNEATVSKGATLAARKGMIVMNSAGNEGDKQWKYIAFPADADSVCTVGATNGSGAIAGFSSRGYTGKIKPNIVSVGVQTVIAGLNNQPSSGNGTSFANPNVAGLVACLWQAFPAKNNMQILNAVYKSSDRYSSPDSAYGFGIPNFRKAYIDLKHEQNVAQYGNEWLFASPNPFTNKIDVTLIGQVDSVGTLFLVGPSGEIIATHTLTTQQEELYNYTFDSLDNLFAGSYTIRYVDYNTSHSVQLQKVTSTAKDWLIVSPNPYRSSLNIYFKAPETGEVSLRLIDAKGSTVAISSLTVAVNETRNVRMFTNKLAAGVYFLQYISSNQKRLIKVVKY